VIEKPIGEEWKAELDIGWPLFGNRTVNPVIDNNKYHINEKYCRGISYCNNTACFDYKEYSTTHSDYQKRHTTTCKECDSRLKLDECPAEVLFTHNITKNVFIME
jgi:hypothetical protein